MLDFLKSPNFMKLVYVLIATAAVFYFLPTKQEVIELYKITLQVCK